MLASLLLNLARGAAPKRRWILPDGTETTDVELVRYYLSQPGEKPREVKISDPPARRTRRAVKAVEKPERAYDDDEDFIDIYHESFEAGCALVLCSDGLTDLVPSKRIRELVERHP